MILPLNDLTAHYKKRFCAGQANITEIFLDFTILSD
jgi:hypothetical protein